MQTGALKDCETVTFLDKSTRYTAAGYCKLISVDQYQHLCGQAAEF